MKAIFLPQLTEDQMRRTAMILWETGKLDWGRAKTQASSAPGEVFAANDEGQINSIAEALKKSGLSPEIRERESKMELSEDARRRIFNEELVREQSRRRVQEEERAKEEARRQATLLTTPEQEASINRWSWGGGMFEWIYLSAMNANQRGIVVLLISLIPYLGALAMFIYVGLKGRRIAWESREWKDYDDFEACQRIWDRWALWILAMGIVLGALVVLSGLR
ncbi:MAG: hypothetical protein E6G98_07645 [Bacillati bacterium ANGP1]|uniref:Uncharacterized protein n=1 Tax=Candidatus Segetimicrobium genomatis TaxID=2569760 RepID=A0A537LRS7_9BACT|nr:MAG: hypothetical protein E6G98_07645 [Terrabacteria group bacterium ANGP1]